MFNSVRRTLVTLLHTPLIPPPPPAVFELVTINPTAGPSRPVALRTLSTFSSRSIGYDAGHAYGMTGMRGYASEPKKKELYSDEAGSTGAGTDDVAHTDAAFDMNADPKSSAKKIEKETGKDFTKQSPANREDSHPPSHQQGKEGTADAPLRTSRSEAGEGSSQK